jgi:hypothetical protein
MQLDPRSSTTNLMFVAVLMSVAMPACDKNGSSDQAPTAAKSEQATPAGSAESEPGKTEPSKTEPGKTEPGKTDVQAQAQLDASCPMLGKDVTVQTSDTPDGAALSFTTAGGDVEQLRSRVKHMADMYEMHGGRGSMMWHQHGHMHDGAGQAGEAERPGMGNPMPASMAKYEEIEGGARIVFTPRDSKDLDAMREQVHDHQRRMSGGECWTPPAEKTGA